MWYERLGLKGAATMVDAQISIWDNAPLQRELISLHNIMEPLHSIMQEMDILPQWGDKYSFYADLVDEGYRHGLINIHEKLFAIRILINNFL